jgi:catechol 2,3-dioxygenase-like lactoylglutathione lyase family enzyme
MRVTRMTARRARGRSTAMTTTAGSSSTRTGTAPRRSTTGRCGRVARSTTCGIRVADLAASKRFYETVAPYGGFRLQKETRERAQFVGASGSFSVVAGTPTANVHIAFGATENATVDAFHQAALEAGYRDNGAPGERQVYHAGYYGAYVLDPDENSIEVVNHNRG